MHKDDVMGLVRSQANVPTPSDSLPRHLASLQWLRAIAALAVVYFHAAIQVRQLNPEIKVPIIGAMGVDIFFVLSGFIMWVTTRHSHVSTGRFIVKRIERIAPLYWLLSIIVAIFALLMPHLLNSTRFDPAHLLASLFFIPWPNPAGVPGTSEHLSPILIPGWTLNMEMMFYLLFSLCLPLRKGWRVASISLLIIVLYVIGLMGAKNGSIAAFYGNTIILEFLMGILLAAYLIPFLSLSAPWAWGLLALSLIVLAGIEAAGLDLPRAVKFGVPAFFAIAAAINLERLSAVPNFSALVKLGDASYSIYLSHIFVLAGLRVIMGFLGIGVTLWTACAFMVVGMAASAILGLLIHEYVEKPLSRFKVRIGRRDSKSVDTAPQH
ncbi:acyltransferase family protein [Altericroceibacterium xinjiangense]|uniref:acyltransferase family protein n=1 Tax=Altericroceibacterium xinjiangense TaxID=762261 RepID=UPI000F7EAB60|nr:acyltransferase [Altericroceibacterium xinjiangense]